MKRIILSVFVILALCSMSSHVEHITAPYSIRVSATKRSNGLVAKRWSYWCPSVIRDSGGLYHMFASKFANHCGLNSWAYNSEIVHAVSLNPLGPFIDKGTVVPAMAHNPAVVRAQDGSFLLYYIGRTMDSSSMACRCMEGRTDTTMQRGLTPWICDIWVRHSISLNGPWSSPHRVSGLLHVPVCASNPAPLIERDGSISLYYRAYHLAGKCCRGSDKDSSHTKVKEYLYCMKAKTWDGAYTASCRKVLDEPAEDPAVWKDPQGYGMVFNNKFNDKENIGGYAFSRDGKKFSSQPPVYSRIVSFTDGTQDTLRRRERPDIVWINDKEGVLYNGVEPGRRNDKTYILAVPISKELPK